MQTFINEIFNFVYEIYTSIVNIIYNKNPTFQQDYINFLSKPIISGDLINIGLTWRELFLFGFTWALTIFFIVFFVRLVFKVIRLICLR